MDPTKKRKLEENGIAPESDAGLIKIPIEDARKIIEPFTHEQLLEIVTNAMVRHLDVLAAVRSVADRDPTQRKLFVRGLGWDTSTDNLRSLFSTYGELEEAIVILDKATGKSKGFGFVTFKHVDGALLALKEPSKKIDGRMTVTQLAAAGLSGAGPNLQTADVAARKIYVATVPQDMPAERLLAHFSSYGEIEEGPLGFDKATGKSKGFALFVYKTAEAARASLVDPVKNIDGVQLNCKLAIDGKRGKVGMPVTAMQGGAGGVVQGPNVVGPGEQPHVQPPSSVPGSFGSQYGGPGGIAGYSGYPGGLPGAVGHHPLSTALGSGGPGLSSVGVGPGGLSSLGSQAPSAFGAGGNGYGAGLGGPYGGSHFGGPSSAAYGGLGGGLAGGSGGLIGSGGGLGGGGLSGAGAGLLAGAGAGLGGPGRGSSLYGLPPSSVGMQAESAHYSLSSSGYQSQHQTTGASQAPRVPHGGSYPPYF